MTVRHLVPLTLVAVTAAGAAALPAHGATGSSLREGVRNPSGGGATRETQIISGVTGASLYGTRQSNISTGPDAGGSAIYGCRRPQRECIRANNLVGGLAAAFASRGTPLSLSANEDTPAGTPALAVDPEFSGEVKNLNAELWGGFTPASFLVRLQTTGVAGPKGDKGDPGLSNGPAGGALTGNYPNPTLGEGVVEKANIADLSVTATKIDNGSVETAKIANGAVTQAKLGGAINANTVGGLPPAQLSSGAGARETTDIPISSTLGTIVTSPTAPVHQQSHAILNASLTVSNGTGADRVVNCSIRRTTGDLVAVANEVFVGNGQTVQLALTAIDDAPPARQWQIRCNTSSAVAGMESTEAAITAVFVHSASTIG